MKIIQILLAGFFTGLSLVSTGQSSDSRLLTIDRIYQSDEFRQDYERDIQWIENGKAYVTIENSDVVSGGVELIRYNTKDQSRTVFVSARDLMAEGKPLEIESFSLSPDGTKVLIFNNSSRVWRTNTKGDYWVFDLASRSISRIGSKFGPSSLLFAKFSADNRFVAYVHDFNIYKEDYNSGNISQLTFDGNRTMINGTFDWAYEEEFGKRDGFLWSPESGQIAFWQIDASAIGTHYMINNTDSVYSEPIPLQYPKVGQEPSGAKVGLISKTTENISWIPIPGDPKAYYIPGMQWVSEDLLLIQQLNRKQNQLRVWSYRPSSGELKQIYEENEETWIELLYPDISGNGWGNNDLLLVDKKKSFLRMTEGDEWRHIYKIDIENGTKTLLTPGAHDVASIVRTTTTHVYFIASPENSTQRYLYRRSLSGRGSLQRITPQTYPGINTYNISPDGAYAFHIHRSTRAPRTVRLISLPDHKVLKTMVDNKRYEQKLAQLDLPEVQFTKVKTIDGIEIDARIILPTGFVKSKKYPVIFHVYGEPWGQVALDAPIGLWNIMMAQKGYVIVDMDNRGTPCLKGSAWRKSIYRKVGIINTRDQAMAAKEILKLDYIDPDRTAVWGWSGGGSMTLNLMFQFPEIYKVGVAVAAVSDQLIYDNIYQERYMGLPQENIEDFINGSPVTHAKNLKGDLLVIHGTADDNVHYQSAEILINELIRQNKQFSMMAYPNRSHSINEGDNTTRHLYTLITEFITSHL